MLLTRNRNLRKNSGNISEFGPAFFILLFIFILPLINLVWVGASLITIALAANYYVSAAVVETSYDRSLAAMYSSASQFNSSGWNFFGGLTPFAGYGGSGSDLFVKATDISSHDVERFGPNVSAPPPIDTSGKVWEFEAKVVYDVRPLINLSSVPFINNVPLVGTPARLQYSAHKLVEHPSGLATVATNTTFGKEPLGSIKPNLPSGGGGGGVLPTDTSWYHPDIYQLIQNAGQSIVAEEVLILRADNPNWTEVPILDIQPGHKIWIDYRADGRWNTNVDNSASELMDANGSTVGVHGTYIFPEGSVIGKLGTGEPFFLGKEQLNFVPPGTGQLKLLCFDGTGELTEIGNLPRLYTNNEGVMSVRIIVAK